MMETIAMYWEPVIKTYGILERGGLELWSMTFGCDLLSQIPPLAQVEPSGRELELAAAVPLSDGRIRLHLLLCNASPLPSWVRAIGESCGDLQKLAPVAVVYLQGPHFGDRFGIADAALTALAAESVDVLVAACTGASLHFVVPQESAAAARQALATAFVVPGAPDCSKPK